MPLSEADLDEEILSLLTIQVTSPDAVDVEIACELVEELNPQWLSFKHIKKLTEIFRRTNVRNPYIRSYTRGIVVPDAYTEYLRKKFHDLEAKFAKEFIRIRNNGRAKKKIWKKKDGRGAGRRR